MFRKWFYTSLDVGWPAPPPLINMFLRATWATTPSRSFNNFTFHIKVHFDKLSSKSYNIFFCVVVLSLYIHIYICLWVECFSSVSPFLPVSCWDVMHVDDKLCIHWIVSVSVPDKQTTDMRNFSADWLLLLAALEQEWIAKEDVYKCSRLDQRSHYRLCNSHFTVCTALLT